MHLKRKFAKAPLVSTEVRRSERIKENHKGFKDSQCKGKSCICCNIEPPTLSNKVMRCLGKELCKISSKALIDEELKKKPHSRKLAGPRVKQNKEKQKEGVSNGESKKKEDQEEAVIASLVGKVTLACF
jgi:hypothetical protein